MQFKVPQFLEIEDKIFGPFTFKQFVYLAGGAGLCFIIYKGIGLLFGFIPMAAVAGIALALTFYRPNNKPLINMIESWFKYTTQSKLYIWQRRKNKLSTEQQKNITADQKAELLNQNNVKMGASKLRDLAWSLDVLDLKKENNENL
ncbi:MAG: PrgI family protein [Candidatus Paceibacterota bacterium]|jgi:hypothetical protein